MIYSPSDHNKELRQGEILSNLTQSIITVNSLKGDVREVREIVHPAAIIMDSDCDLLQHYQSHGDIESAKRHLSSVICCEVHEAEAFRTAPNSGLNSAIWKQVKQNKNERYQFLEAVPDSCDSDGEGLPDLILDFRRHFAIPIDEIYARLDINARRRCVLQCPYLEHCISRFCYYLGRVALPRDHGQTDVIDQ